MLCRGKQQCRFLVLLILFVLTNLSYIQSTTIEYRSSNIEIIPSRVVIDSPSITDFLCVNHASDNARLEAKLTQLIPTNQMKMSTNLLNQTTMNIRLELNNYVGIFHLLCYAKDEQSKGNRADVIVKAAPGVLQRIGRCRVYDRQYIKCIIKAPTIARAIENGYPPIFEFNESTHPSDSKAYIPRVEFLKNESTNEYLVFKWRPTVVEEFPNGVQMHMKAMLPFIDEASYYFDMTPVFIIKPTFILQALSSSEIQVNLTPSSPSGFCEKSIVPQLTSNINQTWSVIESERNTILVNNLLSDTIYRVCIKCRQIYTDPDGLEKCEEIKTLSKISTVSIVISGILAVILMVIVGIIFYVLYKKYKNKPTLIDPKNQIIPNARISNRYDVEPLSTRSSNGTLNSDNQASAPLFTPSDNENEDPVINTEIDYRSIASINDVINATFPQILSSSGTFS